MTRMYCGKCNYMENYGEVMVDVALVSPICPHCQSLMYYKINNREPDWENYPTVSC